MIDIKTSQAYWDVAAETYDHDFPETLIGTLQREEVWRQLDRVFHPGQRILELNCGTGLDAMHLAKRGVQVLACDISPRMIELARRRMTSSSLRSRVELRVLPIQDLHVLGDELVDGTFSNFSGLNCVKDLSLVSENLARILRPGSRVLACMIGRFYAWEIVWYLAQANPKKAFRRFSGAGEFNRTSQVEVYFHSIGEITRMFAPRFRLRGHKGIGIALPPCYAERRFSHVSPAIRALAKVDRLLAVVPLFRSIGDCVLLEFERVAS